VVDIVDAKHDFVDLRLQELSHLFRGFKALKFLPSPVDPTIPDCPLGAKL